MPLSAMFPPCERRLGADREDDRILHEVRELRASRRRALRCCSSVVQDVPLRDDEDDLVARGLEQLVLEEAALALLEDLARVEQEEHRVGARDVAVGDVGALQRQIVHAWGVDEEDALLEQRGGVADLEVVDLVRRSCRRRRRTCASSPNGSDSRLPDV